MSTIFTLLKTSLYDKKTVRCSGGTLASNALLIARLASSHETPLVVISPDEEVAHEIASDIDTFYSTLFDKSQPVRIFPGWELSPYSPAAPSIRTRFARIGTLGAISSSSPPQILITTLAASLQSTVPVSVLKKNRILLRAGEETGDRGVLIEKLLAAAYLRVDTVEDPGTFAVRGDILDLFLPEEDHPFRMEFFGDFIDQIRKFDPSTQKTLHSEQNQIGSAHLFPAREVLLQPETIPLLREQLKKFADDRDIPRNIRDPLLENVQQGVYVDHCDFWSPFSYAEPSTLWSHIPSSWPIIWYDEPSCLEGWTRFLKEQPSQAEEAYASGLLLPSPELLFPNAEETKELLQKTSSCFFDRIDLLRSSTPTSLYSLKTQVFPNTDLVSGSRHSLGELESQLRSWTAEGFKVVVFAATESQIQRIRFLLEERRFFCAQGGPPNPRQITLHLGSLSGGFRWIDEALICLTEGEILGTRHLRKIKDHASVRSSSTAKDWSGLQALTDLSIGDAIVHRDHGIGLYQGLVRLDLTGAPSDFLLLEYANKDKLYLPIYRLNVIQKYVGSGETVSLARLGSQNFFRAKEKVKEAVKKLAIDLVQLYAERKIRPGVIYTPRDASFREFEAQFPFDETPDQLGAIEDTQNDLETAKIMDRLVCGDVGYGKTEVAIRAAFRVVADGKQVAILVPTTILAHQHEQSFKTRLKNYPIQIESLTRFKSTREQKQLVEEIASGKVDIAIGTHRLLSRDIRFKDLGLVVIDEEHRFGVEHKERLKTMRSNIHVLTLTATPIPRTLHMALSGLRDISLMNTPPVDRLPIRTFISKYDENLIQRAIETEMRRGGQIFFLHNRVQTIQEAAANLQTIVPKAKVLVAHGQMSDKILEEAMVSFYNKKADVLVCTSIIESGLDIPSANTIFINRADTFGLAQLYQIRGRVGRGQYRAFAYLLLPKEGTITELAKRRLEVLQRFVELGSGFSIASHDLEIRGGGDLLGPQQSGHIAAVGFDLYTELLEEAIQETRGKPLEPEDSLREPEIKMPFPAFLSENYVPGINQRLSLYRRFSAAQQESEIDRIEEELRDRFGPPPEEAQNLLWLIRIKRLLKKTGIDVLTVGQSKASLTPSPKNLLDPQRIIELISKNPKQYQITPDSKIVSVLQTSSIRDFYFSLEAFLNRVCTQPGASS